MSAHLPEVERYLRHVTCLLPRPQAAMVRAELLGNLHQTMLDARLRGLNEVEAWQTALAETGPSLPTALRFARLYTLGLLTRWLLVGAALGGAAYAVQGTQTVPPTSVQARP